MNELPSDLNLTPQEMEELKSIVINIFEKIKKAFQKFIKQVKERWYRIWCDNTHLWHIAKHHKKYRIRKEYMNKIRKEAAKNIRYFITAVNNIEQEEYNYGMELQVQPLRCPFGSRRTLRLS